jgi:protein MpaA
MTMQRLNKNQGAYLGEIINIEAVLRDMHEAARLHSWQIDALPVSETLSLPAFTHHASRVAPHVLRIYVSAGIHGDEPAGPLAVRQLLQDNPWPADADIFLCPCLNPEGFRRNRRENEDGIDLNRDYLHFQTAAIRAHAEWLLRQPPFDFCLCLHEDWESHGFYVYELNPDNRPSLAAAMIESVAPVCPIDLSPVIEGRDASGGIIRPNPDLTSRPQWPEAFFLLQKKARLSYTLEAPSDFPLVTRVAALVAATKVAFKAARPASG